MKMGIGGKIMDEQFPQCLKCEKGVLIPMSDYGRQGSEIRYKAWICTNPDCGFNFRIDNGEISIGHKPEHSNK